MKNGNSEYEEQMLRDMDEMVRCLRLYGTRLSPGLATEEKEKLMRRIYDFRSKNHPLKDKYPVSEFPELEKYWEKDSLSGLELVIILDELYKEVRGSTRE